jgi:hypothetical protein
MNPNLEKEMQEFYERKNRNESNADYHPVRDNLFFVGLLLLVLVYFKLPYAWTWQLKIFAIVVPLVAVYYFVKFLFKKF